jgi:hypothetical protein
VICHDHLDMINPLERPQPLGPEPKAQQPITGGERQNWRVRDDTPPEDADTLFEK